MTPKIFNTPPIKRWDLGRQTYDCFNQESDTMWFLSVDQKTHMQLLPGIFEILTQWTLSPWKISNYPATTMLEGSSIGTPVNITNTRCQQCKSTISDIQPISNHNFMHNSKWELPSQPLLKFLTLKILSKIKWSFHVALLNETLGNIFQW